MPNALLSFDDMLTMIEDRSNVLRSAAAGNLDAGVPGCPGWSVRDLVVHLGEVHLFWTAAVAAGPAAGPPDEEAIGDREPHGDLLTWSAGATSALIGALMDAGPERECWTWWESSGAPMTAGAVARHQVQEAAVHALDAQQAAGQDEPLPPALAADGVGEFLTVGLGTMGPWPHDPATVLLSAADGGDWLLRLRRDRLQILPLPDADSGPISPDTTITASPSDLVLAFYRRHGPGRLLVAGDWTLVTRLLDWPDMD